MNVGHFYIILYILLVGTASFLMKFTMKTITPYQINFLMAIGMLLTAFPALYFVQKNFVLPTKQLPLGILVGLMMALGSIAYVLALSKIEAGTAAALSSAYLIVVVLLSRVFLNETLDFLKIVGILLTVIGVAILSRY